MNNTSQDAQAAKRKNTVQLTLVTMVIVGLLAFAFGANAWLIAALVAMPLIIAKMAEEVDTLYRAKAPARVKTNR